MAGHCKKHHQTVSVVLHFHLNIPLRARKMGLSRYVTTISVTLLQLIYAKYVETSKKSLSFNRS